MCQHVLYVLTGKNLPAFLDTSDTSDSRVISGGDEAGTAVMELR
jgi:hypothetical protein